DKTWKGRPQPINRAFHITVLDRIPVDVFDRMNEIVLAADRMLPKARLPDSSLSVRKAVRRRCTFLAAGAEERSREGFLDLADAQGVLAVARRQSPHPMNMVRQPDPRDLHIRPFRSDLLDRVGQELPILIHPEQGPALVGNNREKEGAARDVPTTVIGHG